MIDLDLSSFKGKNNNIKALDLIKTRTLAKMQDTFDLSLKFEPATIIWSGNGYHFYIPAESENVILEQMSEFSKYKEPSKLLLRFAEWYLSNGKADSDHYHTVSFKNCLLRIPGSYNSKNMSLVSTVQKWNGAIKVPLHLLYGKFLAYLIDQGSKVVKHQNNTSTILSEKDKFPNIARNNSRLIRKKEPIGWIEHLLQTPLPDHRKYCIWQILVPYLINVRKLSNEEAFSIIEDWLDICDQAERLDFDPQTKINDVIKRVGDYRPISLDNLKTENKELYDLVSTRL